MPTISAKQDGVGAASQPLILLDEQSDGSHPAQRTVVDVAVKSAWEEMNCSGRKENDTKLRWAFTSAKA